MLNIVYSDNTMHLMAIHHLMKENGNKYVEYYYQPDAYMNSNECVEYTKRLVDTFGGDDLGNRDCYLFTHREEHIHELKYLDRMNEVRFFYYESGEDLIPIDISFDLDESPMYGGKGIYGVCKEQEDGKQRVINLFPFKYD